MLNYTAWLTVFVQRQQLKAVGPSGGGNDGIGQFCAVLPPELDG
jgi:hypothetical protein